MASDSSSDSAKADDPVLRDAMQHVHSESEQASHNLLNAALKEDGYKTAVHSEFEAEANWHHAFSKGQTALTQTELSEMLKNPKLDTQSQGFMHFLQDNFEQIAGCSANAAAKADKVSINDVIAIGGMNEVSPGKIRDGVDFVQNNFFALSGLDNKVTADRVEKLTYDHSFLLLPKSTQELLYDLKDVVKSANRLPADFDHGKRVKSGLTEDDARALKADALSDNLRVQALEKGMFGTSVQKFDSNVLGPKAQQQFDEAAKRYNELKSKGLDKYLQKFES
jgi:hypothetical protein